MTVPSEYVIDINRFGVVNAQLNEDKFPLDFLGEQEIHRASEILWDKDHQCWRVTLVDQDYKGTFDNEVQGAAFMKIAYGAGSDNSTVNVAIAHYTRIGFKSNEEAKRFEVRLLNEMRKLRVPIKHPYDWYQISAIAAYLVEEFDTV